MHATPPVDPSVLIASAPAGRGWHALAAGLSLYDVRPRVNAVLPLPTGQIRVARSLGRGVDLGLRYGTVAFVSHEISLFTRLRIARGARWALGATLEGASGMLPWGLQERLLFIDVSARAGLSLGIALGAGAALHLDATSSVRLYETTLTEHGRFADSVPVLRSAGVSAAVSWGRSPSRRYAVRARADCDPYRVIPASVAGLFIGVSFEWSWLR